MQLLERRRERLRALTPPCAPLSLNITEGEGKPESDADCKWNSLSFDFQSTDRREHHERSFRQPAHPMEAITASGEAKPLFSPPCSPPLAALGLCGITYVGWSGHSG